MTRQCLPLAAALVLETRTEGSKMRRRFFWMTFAALLCGALFSGAASAKKLSLKAHAQIDAKHGAFATAAVQKAAAARKKLAYAAAATAEAQALRKGLSEKQQAALLALSRITLASARQAAAQKNTTFTPDPARLRGHVLATGATNAAALAVASLLSAAELAEQDVLASARKLAKHLEYKKTLREDIAALREVIANWSGPTAFTWHESGKAHTVELQTTDDANALLQKLESQLDEMQETSQMLQLQLQLAVTKQQQAMPILSSIKKSQHDTLKAIIQNMK